MENILLKRSFSGNVLTLMTGTTIAQAIPIALSPILTRFYTPEDFGVLALYMAVCGIVSTVATARYELAIMLPAEEEGAINLVALSMAVAVAVSVLTLIVVIVFNGPIARLLGNKEIGGWLYFIPVSILLTGIYQSLNYWANRKQHYRRMANSRVMQSVGTVGTQVAGGWADTGAGGLIAGSLIGQVLATLQLARVTWTDNRALLRLLSARKCGEVARRYIDHPKYLVVSHGVSSVYAQIPIFFISKFYSLIGTGHVSFASRMVSLPSALVANAIGDVFRQRAAEDFIKYGKFDSVFIKTLGRTALLGLPFFFVFFFFSEHIFALMFGENWRVAGRYARILAVSSYFAFVFTPIDKGALIREKLGYIFHWHLFRLFAFMLVSILSWNFGVGLSQFLIAITSCNVVFYAVDGFFEYRFSKGL